MGKKVNSRQALSTTPRKLINLALQLLEEDIYPDTKCLIVIVNKSGMSDDWKIEE